jgi:hypothetical protein
MRHFASPSFWEAYRKLHDHVRVLADRNYALLKENLQHPSLHFKEVLGNFGRFAGGLAIGHLQLRSMKGWSGSGSARTRAMIG